MSQTMKSKILLAHVIAWAGAITAALILTYLPHGPARHPKMLVVCLVLGAGPSLVALRNAACSPSVFFSHVALWGIAMVTAFSLVNTSLGEGVHPITTTVVLAVLGVVSRVILSNTQFDESGSAGGESS